MINVLYVCVFQQHDLRLVALAALVCLFACFTTTNLYVRAQEAFRGRRLVWLAAASVVFGGGVWTTHFVAELAYRPGLPIGYDADLTALSALIAIVCSGIGLAVALQTGAVAAGGALVGAAVGAMHFTGVAAMRAPAEFFWNWPYVAASIAIGMAFAAAAFHVQSLGTAQPYRMAAAGLLVLAIVGLHFTAMAALTLVYDPSIAVPSAAIAPDLLATTVAGVTAIIITIGLAGAVADSHLAHQATSEAHRLAQKVAERTAELHAAQAELLHQERLSTMGQLTATVAHELRNPLSAVRNSLYVVREALGATGPDIDRSLARAERNIARCDRIIGDLLDYTRVAELRPRRMLAEEWIEEILVEQRPPDGIAFTRDYGAAGAFVRWDPERMRRVLGNLLENAIQAVADSDGAHHIVVRTRRIAGQIEIAVVDDGPGIAPDVLPRVFEPLYSTKSFGTGLGLSAVKQIVEQHAGTARIESSPGRGAAALLLLPLDTAAEMAA